MNKLCVIRVIVYCIPFLNFNSYDDRIQNWRFLNNLISAIHVFGIDYPNYIAIMSTSVHPFAFCRLSKAVDVYWGMSFINDRPNALFWLNWLQWPIRRRRGSQNNFTDEFSPDVAVWNKSKMAAMGNTLCIIRYRIFIFIMGKNIQCQVHVYNGYLLYSFRYATLIQRTKITYRKHTVLREILMYCSKLLN